MWEDVNNVRVVISALEELSQNFLIKAGCTPKEILDATARITNIHLAIMALIKSDEMPNEHTARAVLAARTVTERLVEFRTTSLQLKLAIPTSTSSALYEMAAGEEAHMQLMQVYHIDYANHLRHLSVASIDDWDKMSDISIHNFWCTQRALLSQQD